MLKRLSRIPAFAVLCVSVSGCAMWFAQSWDSGTNGPAGRFKELQAILPEGVLGTYKNVEVLPFAEQIPHLAPSPVVTSVAHEIAAAIEETKLFLVVTTVANQPPQGTLVIQGEIVYYDPGEVNERVLGISGECELIARVSLIDKETGNIIGKVDARGIVKTTFNEAETVSQGVAKGVAKWIKENHPLAKEDNK
ncbi:MAG: hypothetical protein GXP25_22795 [Planctomycetes bacterium]|nr:hypothetical protein [Planctomycetota bacterium]